MKNEHQNHIRQAVRERYAGIAGQKAVGCGCNTPSTINNDTTISAETVSRALGYSEGDIRSAPEGANLGLGCGNPRAIAGLKTGETVLDLGSGAGFDCFLAANNVGNSGSVIGVDMTPEMIEKARQHAETNGSSNVEFRLGEIEHLPAADNSIDVIMSNCVINLSPEKSAVFNEAFRVLKPGGRLAISDIVATKPLPPQVRHNLSLVTGCVGGAECIEDVEQMLWEAGFIDVRIESLAKSREFIKEWFPGYGIEDHIVSASISAIKPVESNNVGTNRVTMTEEKYDIVLPFSSDWAAEIGATARSNMEKYDSCTQSILAAFMESLNLDEPMVMRSAGAMFGGMLSSLTCGIHTAGLMVLGLIMGRETLEEGFDGLIPVVIPAQKLVKQLNHRIGSHSCLELTGVDFTDLKQAMRFKMSADHDFCVQRVEDGAYEIARFLQTLEESGDLFRFIPRCKQRKI
ncbi:MAG: arsenite methyltransferase [Desulfobacterales bacterium]